MQTEQQNNATKPKTLHYNNLSVSLHWLMALMVVALFALGFWMVDLTYYSSWYKTAPYWHKSIGILLFALLLLRLFWRFKTGKPEALASQNMKLQQVAAIVHMLLYLLLFSIVLTGYLISTADGRGIEVFSWFELPALGELFAEQADIAGALHKWFAYVLMALVAMHAAGAVKHHFVDKDATLKRMWWHKN
ncbi:cytochrome b [Rheinheimera sp. 4Y26]|uniref:cytochrome b n=1 Tax=Rheinheimera sp. 4Y26 TaxID=2977811 RepID=UPI0021B153F3|nr:cytochrome b [Rheinheimera sp. 4Y26]MCT6699376.1 cytochrome b [Rheinheimera sp. 4Y26]